MKRIAVALLVAVAATASQRVSAADLAVATAPASVPYPNWTGFYIGVHAGAAWQSAPNWSFTDPNLVLVPFNLSGSTGLGAVGGIQGGYNWQFASAWVVGIEGDISWASLSDHRTNGPFSTIGGGPVPASSVSMSTNTEWLSSVRGKLGIIGWNTLWYVTGGGAWANIEFAGTAMGGVPASQAITSFNTTKSGWVVGGGAEWQATTNILLRAEYLYYGISNANVIAPAPVIPPVAAVPLPLNFNFSNYNVQVFRIAGSYKF
jgi:outer membrane immunogenic protein